MGENPHSQNQLLNQYISKLEIRFILIDNGLCPDWSREEHTRMRDCFYLILDGQGKITVNGEEFYPKKDDMVLLPKNSRVSLYSENETCYNKYWCDFSATINGKSLFDIIDFPYVVHIENPDYVKSLFNKLSELRLKNDAVSALMIKSILIELLAIFLSCDKAKPHDEIQDDEFVKFINDYIKNHIHEKISVKSLSNLMGFNEKYFISIFNKHFGITPALYIKHMRLETAKYDLLYTDHSIAFIADTIGFSTIQKLSKDFKEYTSFTPTEFRKTFK